jgi:hypothetical protein
VRNPLTRERERATTILFDGIVLFLGYLFLRIVAIPGPPRMGSRPGHLCLSVARETGPTIWTCAGGGVDHRRRDGADCGAAFVWALT